MKQFLLIIFALSLSFFSYSQTFVNTYGGQYHEEARDIIQTYDSGFAVVGRTQSYSNGNYDIWLTRLKANGDTLWTRNYGGTQYENAKSIAQMPDSGFIIGGNTKSYGINTPSTSNWYLVRLDKWGDTLWTWVYENYGNDELFHVLPTSDGGFVVSGWEYYGGYAKGVVIKLDSARNTSWTNYIPSGANSHVYEAIEEANGDILVTANSLGGTFNVFLRRYNLQTGSSQLAKTYHSSGSYADAGFQLAPAPNGGYMLAGIYGNYGSYKFWLLRLDSNLDTLWTKTYPSMFYVSQLWQNDISISAHQGGYIVCGPNTATGVQDAKIVKIDTSGNVLWTEYHGTQYQDKAIKVITTYDDKIAVCGYALDSINQQNFLVLLADSTGSVVIPQPPSFASLNLSGNIGICMGDSVLLTTLQDPNYSYTWYHDSVIVGGNTHSIWANTTGDWWVEISAGGTVSDSSDIVTVAYHQLTPIFLGTDTLIYYFDSITLDAGNNFISYLWSTGDTTQTLLIKQSNQLITSDTVSLIAIDSNNCTSSDTIIVYYALNPGIDERLIRKLSISLCPASSQFEISIDEQSGPIEISLFSISGQLMLRERHDVGTTKCLIQTDFLENGVYLIKVTDSKNQVYSGKIIIYHQ